MPKKKRVKYNEGGPLTFTKGVADLNLHFDPTRYSIDAGTSTTRIGVRGKHIIDPQQHRIVKPRFESVHASQKIGKGGVEVSYGLQDKSLSGTVTIPVGKRGQIQLTGTKKNYGNVSELEGSATIGVKW